MVDAVKLLPVTIPTWPACEDCLSWSEDYLAVAGGEVVHILIAKNSSAQQKIAGHPQWKLSSLRVNLFRQDEWPDQHPVTVRYLSIGEEQSLSHVVALAWSPVGLGVHRRAVLAVLTSNLILSFWESDGSLDQFERTYILNRCLSSHDASTVSGVERQKLRVRAFAWLPPVKTSNESKWGLQHIVVADDSGALLVLRVTKGKMAFLGDWQCEMVLHYQQSRLGLLDTGSNTMSPLQRRLYEQTPVTKIETSAWEASPSPTSNIDRAETRRLKITTQRGSMQQIEFLSIVLSKDHDHVSFSFGKHHHEALQNDVHLVDARYPALSVNNEQSGIENVQDPVEHFQESLQPLQDAFDTSNQLAGHYRVRFWGMATSTDGSQTAGCVTIHPSDMIEYTIPSSEKCTLIFANSQSGTGRAVPPLKSAKAVQQNILEFALLTLQGTSMLTSELDRNIIFCYFSLSSLTYDHGTQLKTSWDQITNQGVDRFGKEQVVISTEEQGQSSDASPGLSEKCEICGAAIPFTSDVSGAVCLSGHYFSRCQISFLAIQEPGISKYCTQCGKQFLNLAKLEALNGPCLARAMFDEFDVCPYCQAKFRG